MRILIVEDDRDLAAALDDALRARIVDAAAEAVNG